MKTTTKNSIVNSWALIGEEISISEFKKEIKESEKGPFYSIEESKKMLEQWREQKNSK